MNIKKISLLVLLVIVAVYGYAQLKDRLTNKTTTDSANPVIAVGGENPGRITLYKKSEGNFIQKVINVGARLVWTVRIGNARNDGQNRIYAGIGNSFYSQPYGCQVVEFDPNNNYKKTIIDEVPSLRCKDLTIGDLKNSGKNNLVLGTHGEGFINLYTYDDSNGSWKKETIDKNYIAQYDQENNTNHDVTQNGIPEGIKMQTAVHIIKIGDVDNDGKNELLATVSDPLENSNKDHVLFVRMFKWNGSSWDIKNIDKLESAIPFKASVDITSLDKSNKNVAIVSTSPHQLFIYRYENGNFKKEPVDTDEKALYSNMKGLAIDYLTNKDKKTIVIGGGIPQSGILLYDDNNGKFEKKEIVSLTKYLDASRLFTGIADNTLDTKIADLDNDGKKEIIAVGEQDTGFAGDVSGVPKFGWEKTTLGFTAVISQAEDGTYKPEFLDYQGAIALEVGNLKF